MDADGLVVAVAARPYPGETVNGDAWCVQQHGSLRRVSVIDGLGHGPDAAAAAGLAVATLDAFPADGPVEALRRCHAALRGSRGAAVTVAQLDLAACRVTVAGIGNVQAYVDTGAGERLERPAAYRGIVGSAIPTVRAFEFALGPRWWLVLHTDGVSARFDLAQQRDSSGGDPQRLADVLLAGWARPTDDATVVVVQPAGPR